MISNMNSIYEIKDYILSKNKDVEVVLINGSFALKKMRKYSDIDMEVITKRKPKREFEFTTVMHNNKKTLVTIFYSRLKYILSSLEDPESWMTLQNYKRAKILYDKNNTINIIKDKIKETKPKKEDFFKRFEIRFLLLFEHLAKSKNAYENEDDVNLILSCRQVAFFSSICMNAFNEVKELKGENEANTYLLEFKNTPKNYNKNFKICYGLDFNHYSREKLYRSVHELVREMYYFMKKRKVWIKVPKLEQVFEDDYFLNLTKL